MLLGALESVDVHTTECHGTGTSLGDLIETTALRRVIMSADSGAILTGVKASLGHGEPSAGMVGLLKLLSTIGCAMVAPNAQLHVLNPHVDDALCGSACRLPAQPSRMSEGFEALRRNGGVSSFGYAGTIAHAVLAFDCGQRRKAPTFGRATDASEVLTADEGVGAACSQEEKRRTKCILRQGPRLAYRRRAFPWLAAASSCASLRRPSSPADSLNLDADSSLMQAGMTSLASIRLAARLHERTTIPLSPTFMFEQPTPRAMVKYLALHNVDGPLNTSEGLLLFLKEFMTDGDPIVPECERDAIMRSDEVCVAHDPSTPRVAPLAPARQESMPDGCDCVCRIQMFDPLRVDPLTWLTLYQNIHDTVARHNGCLDSLALEAGSVSVFAAAQHLGALVDDLYDLGRSCTEKDTGHPMTPNMLADYRLGAFHMLQFYNLEPGDDLKMVSNALDRLVELHPMLRSVHTPPVFWIRQSVSYTLDEAELLNHDASCATDLERCAWHIQHTHATPRD
jgi:hypothetical protein